MSAENPIVIPPLTAEEEGVSIVTPFARGPLTESNPDQIILARITNDERPLRRVLKKFHSYTSLSHTPLVPALGSPSPDDDLVEDAREAFLVELASFQLSLQKSSMICEAEARQVEEYQRERHRIGERSTCPSAAHVLIVFYDQTTSMGHYGARLSS